MNKKINKVLSGIAIGTLSASACIIPVAGSFAGEINQNGIYSWGANTSGSLGNGTSTVTSLPTLSGKSIVNAQKVATSDTHTLFLDSKGNVYASGSNKYGQLGNGNTTSSTTPVKVKLPLRFGVPDYATQIWVGDNVSFMRGSFGDIYSWGSNANGRTGQGLTSGIIATPKKLGNYSLENDESMLSVSDKQVAFIANRTYSISGEKYDTTSLFTFGANPNKVANQNSSASIVSTPTFQLIKDSEEETTYDKEVCKLDTSPDAEKGDTICDIVPTKKTYEQMEGKIPTSVSVGNDFGIVTDGELIYTWGKNTKGQLGRALSTTAVSPVPTTSSSLLLEGYSSPESISAGDEHALVLGSDGLIYGWGDNSRSETSPYYKGTASNYLNVLQRLVIRKEISDNSNWTKVIATNDSSYAMTTNDEVYGWGDNSSKELVQSASQVNTPTKINFPYETQINSFTAGGNNALAITEYVETYTDLGLKNQGQNISSASTHSPYNYTVTAVGGYPGKAKKWTIYGLPKGLSYNSSTGKISGTPTQTGTFDIEVNLSDNVDVVSHNYTLKVSKSTPTLSTTYSSSSPGTAYVKIKVSKGSYLSNGGNYTVAYGTKKVTGKLNSKGEANVKLTGTAGSKVATKVSYAGNSTLNSTSKTGSVTFGSKRNATMSATYSSPNPGQVRSVVTVKDGKNNATGYVYMASGKSKSSKVKLTNGKATITWGGRGYNKNVKVNVVYEGSSVNKAKTLTSKTVKTKSKYSLTPSVSYKVSKKTLTTTVSIAKKGYPVPSGKVYLYDGSKKVGTATLSKGKATFKTTLKKGTHKMKVTYAGNTYYNAKTSSVKSVKIK